MPNKPSEFTEKAGARLVLALEAIRTRHDVTARAVAQAIGTSETAMANWQAGLSTPQPEALAAAKERYGLSLDWIYTGDAQGLPNWLADKVLGPREVKEPAAKTKRKKAG